MVCGYDFGGTYFLIMARHWFDLLPFGAISFFEVDLKTKTVIRSRCDDLLCVGSAYTDNDLLDVNKVLLCHFFLLLVVLGLGLHGPWIYKIQC